MSGLPGGGVEVLLPEAASDDSVIDLDPHIQEAEAVAGEEDHGANLAEILPDSSLSTLAAEVCESYETDLESRADWQSAVAEGMKLMGLKYEDRTYPFSGAAGIYDPLLAEAVLRFQSIARAELLPAAGPVKTLIIGEATQELEDQAERVREFMNLYLTDLAPEYYPDFDQMLIWLGLIGSTFKKIYQDSVLLRPVSPFLLPEDFVVPYSATDLSTTPRATHKIEMTKRELRLRQLNKLYRDVTVPEATLEQSRSASQIKTQTDNIQGTRPPSMVNSGQYVMLEQHRDHVLTGWTDPLVDEPDLPVPYVITVDKESQKVLAVRRAWKRGDPTYARRQYFVHYKMFPGFGFYGLGYAHILGSSAKTATDMRRQLTDAGTLNNFPGGVRVKGMRMEDNNLGIGPCEFREIDTGGLAIQQALMPMPYKEPSPVSFQLLTETREAARSLVGNAEIAIGEGRQDAPVGTTVALMEAAQRVQSGSVRRMHVALRYELKLIAAIFGETLPDQPYPFPVAGGDRAIMRADFSDRIDVLPVSDANVVSSSQRQMRSQAIVQSAMQAPQIHDLRAAYAEFYRDMGLDEKRINALLPTPPQALPFDPLTENSNALLGRPLAAAAYQNHDAHLAVHQPLAQLPNMQAHMAEHMALKMRVMIEAEIGFPLPEGRLPPPVENQVAVLTARAMKALLEPNGPEPTPIQLEMEALRIEAQRVAQEWAKSQGDLALRAYEANLTYRSDEEDRDSKEKIARVKAASDREKNERRALN